MGKSEYIYRGARLTSSHWNNIPEQSALHFSYNSKQEEQADWDLVTSQVLTTMKRIISEDLTSRQKQVMELYYLCEYTQQETANKLEISQPTVSQHLKGKRRQGKKVGGACKRICKLVQKLPREQTAGMSGNDIYPIVKAMIDPQITRRQLRALMKQYLRRSSS